MIFTFLTAARAFLSHVPWQLWAALTVVIVAWMWGNHRYSQGEQAEKSRWELAAAVAKERAGEATVGAAEKRATDTIVNTIAEEARNAAIAAAEPGQAPDDANRRLACERLSRSRPDFDAAAAGC